MDLGYLNIENLQKIYCIIPLFFLSLFGNKNSPEYKIIKSNNNNILTENQWLVDFVTDYYPK